MKHKKINRQTHEQYKLNSHKAEREESKKTKEHISTIMSWAKQISQHPQFYRQYKEDHENYHYYHIIIDSLKKLEMNAASRRKILVQFTAIPYQKQKCSFSGNTHFSEVVEVEEPSTVQIIECGKSVYIYTSHQNLTVRFCVWKLDCEKNSKGGQFVSRRSFLGQFDVEIGPNCSTGSIIKTLNQQENQSLFVNQQNQENSAENQTNSKNEVEYRVLNTHTLNFMSFFVPSQYICDSNTLILGLKNKKIQQNGEIMIAQRNKLRFQIRSVTLPRSTIKKFSEIAEQKVGLCYEIVGLPKSTLRELILHIEYHNGWKSVSRQTLVLSQNLNQSLLISNQINNETKLKNQSKSKSNLKKTSKVNDSLTGNRIFWYEKMKELNAVFVDEGGVLIYWLQAKIEVNFEIIKNKQKQSKAQIIFAPVAFSLKPVKQTEDQQIQKFQFKIGNPFNLGQLTKYLEDLKQQKIVSLLSKQPKIVAEVMYYLLKSKGGMSAVNNIQKQVQQVQELKVERQKLARLKRKLREQKRKKLIELNQEIPFLDPTKLKAQLYEEKIQQMQSQKQEKQDQLFFLRTKIAQLERQMLKNRLKDQQNDQQDHNYGIITAKQLPQNFQDYKPQQERIDFSNQQTINEINTQFCKKLSLNPHSADIPQIKQWISVKTYLNVRIIKIRQLTKAIDQYSFGMENVNGLLQYSQSINKYYDEHENKSFNILLSSNTLETQYKLIESMLNGMTPIYLICDNNHNLKAVGLVDLAPLFQQLRQDGIHSSQHFTRIEFKQQHTCLCELEVVFSFTQNYHEQKSPDKLFQVEKSRAQQQRLSARSRIQRFKEINLKQTAVTTKKAVLEKAFSGLKIQQIELNVWSKRPSHSKLRFTNVYQNSKNFQLILSDQDSSFISQPQVTLQLPQSVKKINHELNQQKNVIQICGKGQLEFTIVYLSHREILRNVYNLSGQKGNRLFQKFNHQHKITLSILQFQSKIVQKIFEITIKPQIDSNAIVIQKYLCEDSQAIEILIPTYNLTAQSDLSTQILPTRILLTVPNGLSTQNNIYGLKLYKQLAQRKVLIQQFQFWIHKCAKQSIQTRLWQQSDILLSIPVEEIIKAEIKFQRTISTLQVVSKHVDLTLRNNNHYQHTVSTTFNKKNNHIYIRGKLRITAVGKQVFPVLINDQSGQCIYRLAVVTSIPFPSLTPNQHITLKIPHDNRQQIQEFSFTNKTGYDCIFEAKSLRRRLVQIVQSQKQLKKHQAWMLQLKFNWDRIQQQLFESDLDELSCLIGLMNGLVIEYVLFKCRLNER